MPPCLIRLPVTDAEREATDAELLALRAQLLAAQRRTSEGVHELLNILAIIKGEIDLATARARAAIDQFYDKFPEFRESP